MPLHQRMIEPLMRLISHLPFPILYLISDIIAPILYHVVRYRRRVVRKNIDNSFPEREKGERRRIERRFYRFFCDYAFETIKLMNISEEEMRRRMKIIGAEDMDKTLDNHPFCFLMVGHYGNWEWLSSTALWSKRRCEQLYTPLHNRTLDAIFYKMRCRFGVQNVSKKDTLRLLIEQRCAGTPYNVGFIADQSPRPESIHLWMDFLHQDTPAFTGAERLGKKFGAAAFFGHVTRPKRGYYECHIEPLCENIAAYKDYEFTELYMRRLEREIREAPHLWLWSHNRWKHTRKEVEQTIHPH